MKSEIEFKKFIIERIRKYITTLPDDVYAIHLLIHIEETIGVDDSNNVPTLSLLYNTINDIDNERVSSAEDCWNIAYWMNDELPIIGCNFDDTEEARQTTAMMMAWFSSQEVNNPGCIEDDDNNITTGYRLISELLEDISNQIRQILCEKFNSEVLILLGDFSYCDMDIDRIKIINKNCRFLPLFLEFADFMC